MKLRLHLLPAWAAIITANLVPLFGAMTGRLFFFQVLYLYWFESLLLIFFDVIRIACARGRETGGNMFDQWINAGRDAEQFTFGRRLWLIVRYVLVKGGMLLFYLIFVLAFIAFQVTDSSNGLTVTETVAFRNAYFNTSVGCFLISMTVQLITGFFLNGRYKVMSPLSYSSFFDARTMLMHVMIISVVFLHKYLFEHRTYAAAGEILYVGLFVFFKALIEIRKSSLERKDYPDAIPMI
jgi:hypothetical protein